MVEYKQGNLLTAKDVSIIGHQVNCLGVMGAGIAKEIKKKFPVVYPAYKNLCNQSDDKKSLMGQTLFVDCDNTIIANMFGQLDIGEGLQTDYNMLKQCLISVKNKAKETNKVVGLPYKIGCGLAGGDWDIVKNIIEEVFNDDVLCRVYSIEKRNIDPTKDGIDHINIYSQGNTELGRMLSNFYHFPIVSKYYGSFNSVEGLWYYMSIEPCPQRELLRKYYGFEAKKQGKELLTKHQSHFEDNFENKILDAIWYKFKNNYKLLKPEYYNLPIYHYYNYKGKIIDVTDKYDWMIKGIEKMREKLIKLIAMREKALITFIQNIPENKQNTWVHIYDKNGEYWNSFHLSHFIGPNALPELKKLSVESVLEKTYMFRGLTNDFSDVCVMVDVNSSPVFSDVYVSNYYPLYKENMGNWQNAMNYISRTCTMI